MSDFQPGDLVIAVGIKPNETNKHRFGNSNTPKAGRAYTVKHVAHYPSWDMAGLMLREFAGWWGEVCFRKIDKADDSFTELVKRKAPDRIDELIAASKRERDSEQVRRSQYEWESLFG